MNRLFTVAAVFNIQGRGTIIVSPHGQENYQYTLGTKGANILLITPEGGTISTLAYQESYTPNRNKVIGLCLPDLAKDEIPVGSDVYTT